MTASLPERLAEIGVEPSARLDQRLRRWAGQVRRFGLAPLVRTMLEAAGPLALISAQGLWVTQPILSLVVPADEVGGLARLLETEDGCHWLCNALLAEPDAAERNVPEHDPERDKGG